MIWTFVLPAIVIVLINTVIMYVVVRTIYRRSRRVVGKSMTQSNKLKQFRKAARGTIMLLPLMGTTWLIGPFAIGSNAKFVEYIFNILNGCQGLFIFLIYCVFDNEMKECFQQRFKSNRVTTETDMT
ncbi:adhesion G-protein coupled receptor D1-like [Antedon mediterranea]|uniref:adhesion G-protein coupled receptor D1-like n=1 Tax=Antedon mediterranea TaxID=105859 RepID=UPI003AF89AD9